MGWPDVTIALIAGLPGIVGAFAALSVRQSVKTPSGTSVGRQIESAHHVSLANNYRLQAMQGNLEIPVPPHAQTEEQEIHPPDGAKHEPLYSPNHETGK